MLKSYRIILRNVFIEVLIDVLTEVGFNDRMVADSDFMD